MFGEQDVLVGAPYRSSLVCISQEGTCYALRKEDFTRLFRNQGEHLVRISQSRERSASTALDSFESVQLNEIVKM
jgi:CRP-like cAMP-binding protein